MYQLKIGTIPLPKLYVCNKSEVKECRRLGVPYIIKPERWSDDKLVVAVLWRTLYKKFPSIRWDKILKFHEGTDFKRLRINVPHVVQNEPVIEEPWQPMAGEQVEVAAEHRENPGYDTCGNSSPSMEVTEDAEYRSTGGGMDPDDNLDFETSTHVEWEKQTIDKYIGDLGYYVNVEELQALRLLPTFLDDIANAIKLNLMNSMWMDGYNKKLGCNVGHWQGSDQAPNLIILDTSGSIPSGVAGTMISLIDTLRHQANADLIITSGRSEYWAANTDLPDPDKLSYLIGGCNERTQFYAILRKHVFGKHWGNVIIFGDQDAPSDRRLDGRNYKYSYDRDPNAEILDKELQSTRIDRIMAFHTYYEKVPGYGLWAKQACPKAEVVYNTKWVDDMTRY